MVISCVHCIKVTRLGIWTKDINYDPAIRFFVLLLTPMASMMSITVHGISLSVVSTFASQGP